MQLPITKVLSVDAVNASKLGRLSGSGEKAPVWFHYPGVVTLIMKECHE